MNIQRRKLTIAVHFAIATGIMFIQSHADGEARFCRYAVLEDKTIEVVKTYVKTRLEMGDDVSVEILP